MAVTVRVHGGGYYTAPQEYIDAREEPVGWKSVGFDDGAWQSAVIQQALSRLESAWVPNIAVSTVRPTSVRQLSPGRWVADLGREVVGGVRLSVDGVAGQTVESRLGEEQTSDGGARYHLRAAQTYREVWTLRDGSQQLEHWGYRAFRWIELVADPSFDLSDAVEAVVLKLPWDDSDAAFTSSDTDLNRVWEMCRYSIEATRLDLYQDTPTRERGPYEGDAIVNQLSEYSTQRSYALARYSTSYLLRRPTWPTEYRLQTVITAWEDYLATGDASNLANDYELFVDRQLDEYLNAEGLVEKDPGHSSQPNGDLVDWPPANRDDYVFTRVNTVINAWQYAAFTALANVAGVLGRSADERRFSALASRLRDALNTRMLMSDGVYRDGKGTDHRAQHATAFPMALGVTEPADFPEAADSLADESMRVSVYGAQFLLDGLYRAGHGDAGHALLTSRERFSWLHMMDDLDATIVMEAWDPSIKPNTTFSHAWGSAPANVVQRQLVGVRPVAPGAAKVAVAPQPGPLSWFDATVPTVRGAVAVRFRRGEVELLEVMLPANTDGRIELDLAQLGDPDPRSLHIQTEGHRPTIEVGYGRVIVDDVAPGRTIIRQDRGRRDAPARPNP